MNRAVWTKCVSDAKWLFVAMALLLFSFAWLRVWVVSLFPMPKFMAIVTPFLDDFGKFLPIPLDHLFSYPGRVALTFVEPAVVFTLSIWAIARGSDAVSGELNRGTMEMVLSQPVSRLSVLWTQAAVTVFGIALLVVITLAGTCVGLHLTQIEHEPPSASSLSLAAPVETEMVRLAEFVSARDLIPATTNLFALGFCVAGFATLLSSFDRYRWRTIGITSGVYILQFIIKGLARSAEPLHWMEWCTLFVAFEPQVFVYYTVEQPDEFWSWLLYDSAGQFEGFGPVAYNLVLLGFGTVCYGIATVTFCRRDLPAPL